MVFTKRFKLIKISILNLIAQNVKLLFATINFFLFFNEKCLMIQLFKNFVNFFLCKSDLII